MHQDLIDEAFRAANRMAADRGISLDGTALMRAVLAVAGEGEGQNEPEEIAEDAMELLGKGNGVSSSRRGCTRRRNNRPVSGAYCGRVAA